MTTDTPRITIRQETTMDSETPGRKWITCPKCHDNGNENCGQCRGLGRILVECDEEDGGDYEDTGSV